MKGKPGVAGVEGSPDPEVFRVTLSQGIEDGSFLAEDLIKAGFRLRRFGEEEIDLEDVFMRITQGITN